MMHDRLNRRTFLKVAGSAAAALALPAGAFAQAGRGYRGPNVIVVRFGGGVRRQETIEAQGTYCPYLLHELVPRGTFFPNIEIAQIEGLNTSHGEGTLNILTGKYDRYRDADDRFLGGRFEAKVPTIFEQLRKAYDIPAHQTLIVNGEDRTDEEFYSFSNHHLFGVDYKSNVLSLYRFKTFLLRQKIAAGAWEGDALAKKQQELRKLEQLDRRSTNVDGQGDVIQGFWRKWQAHYGDSGFVNPRGDRLLTELAVRAIAQLRPRLMMVNYNDPDYVHWGNVTHYTRGIAVIDEGLQRLVATVEADEGYRDNTVFVIVPDCGRDSNRAMAVPCQHHFNSKSSHEIWALAFGVGIASGQVVDKARDQTAIGPTVGKVMGFDTPFAEGDVLSEVFA